MKLCARLGELKGVLSAHVRVTNRLIVFCDKERANPCGLGKHTVAVASTPPATAPDRSEIPGEMTFLDCAFCCTGFSATVGEDMAGV